MEVFLPFKLTAKVFQNHGHLIKLSTSTSQLFWLFIGFMKFFGYCLTFLVPRRKETKRLTNGDWFLAAWTLPIATTNSLILPFAASYKICIKAITIDLLVMMSQLLEPLPNTTSMEDVAALHPENDQLLPILNALRSLSHQVLANCANNTHLDKLNSVVRTVLWST